MSEPEPARELFLPYPTPEGVEEFKHLYKKRFGVDLDPQQALDLATRTLHFVYLAMHPPVVPVVEIIPPQVRKQRPKGQN